MPWITQLNGPSRYQQPNVAIDEISIDEAISMKRECIRIRDSMLSLQKEFAQIRPDFARIFKEQASEYMKRYRGFCYVLYRIACDPPGDSRNVEANPDLSPYIDQAFHAVDLAWSIRNG